MKEIECDVIQDLLPSYLDKITSEATNKLVKKHLQSCNKCSKILEEMNKEVDTDVFNQNEQIDYLKGFRKEKKIAIIKTICIFIIIILLLFLFLQEVVSKFNFNIDIDELSIIYNTQEKIDENTTEIQFNALDTKFNLEFKYDTTNGKDIYIIPVGKFTYFSKPSRTIFYFNINKDTERVFLKDIKGNVKEIWNKDNGILVNKKQVISTCFYVIIHNYFCQKY